MEPIGILNENNDLLGATVTSLAGSDTLKNSRTVINTNFTNLNNDKIETSTTSLPLITTLSGLSAVGTITSGTWASTDIGVPYGGTGASSFAKYHILMGNDAGAITVVATGTESQVLSIVGGIPAWSTTAIDEAEDYDWTGDHSFSATTTFTGNTVFTGNTAVLTPTASSSIASKGYVDGSVFGAFESYASDTLRTSADTTKTVDYADYTKVKEVQFNDVSGTLRIKFDLSGDGSYACYGRVYKNGVALGTERALSAGSFTTYSEDLSFSYGDLIQLYGKANGSANCSDKVKNFRIYYDLKPLPTTNDVLLN